MPGRPEKLLSYLRRQVRGASPREESDAVLLTRYLEERTEEAFAELIRRHGPLVLRVCRRVLGDVQHAEDAFQATFLVLARRARAIRRRDALAAWLHGVALRVALKARTRAAQQRVCPTRERPDPAADPLSQLTAREFLTALDEEVQRLPEVHRLPLLLCGLEGLGVKEVARRLGWTEGSVKGRLERGRTRLHARLATRGWTLAAALGGIELARRALQANLPGRFLYRTAEAALAFAGRKPGVATALSAEVLRLAQFGSGGSIGMKLKVTVLLAFLTSMAVAAGGLASLPGNNEAGQQAGAPAAVPLPINGESSTRVDRHGDALPDGAIVRLGARRFRHEGIPGSGCLTFSADGKMLVGLTYSGVVLWEAATGKERMRLATRLTGFSCGFDLSADGSTLAVPNGPEDEETKISFWNVRSGKNTASLSLPGDAGRHAIVRRVRFAPDGKSLAVTAFPQRNGNQGKVIVFDVASGQVQASLGEGETGYHDLAFSPDGKTLAIAAGSAEYRVEFWDISSWKLTRVTPLQKSYVVSMTFSPDGKTLALGSNRVVFLEAATGKELRQLALPRPGVQIEGLAFTADGEKLVCSDRGGQIVVWHIASGKVLQTIQERQDLFATTLSPDGKTVAVANAWTRTLRLWDLATGKMLFPEYQGHDFGVFSLAMSPADRKLVAAGSKGPDLESVSLSSDGKAMVIAGGTGQVEIWDRTKGRPTRKLPGQGRNLAFSPDGTKLAAVAANRSSMTSKVRVWDFASGKEALLITVPDTDYVEMASFCADGKKLATLDRDQKQNGFRVRHWDLATGKQERLWKVPLQSYERSAGGVLYGEMVTILPAELAGDGRTVVAGSGKSAQVFDAASGRRSVLASSGEGSVHFRASPDARFVATWMLHGNPVARGDSLSVFVRQPNSPVRIVEVLTSKEVAVLKRKHDCVAVVAWSADGRFLATGDDRLDSHLATDDQTVRLWDLASGKELACFTGFKADVTALALAPDDTQLFAALRDGTVLGWDIAGATRKARIAQQPSKDQLDLCWNDLGGEGSRAYQAHWQLLSAPKDALRLLASRLKPAPAADAARIQQAIANMGSERFAVRQAAVAELKHLGEQAKGPVEQALKANPSLEARRRLEQIRDYLSSAIPGPATVQTVRAVIVLEKIGSAEARQVLEALAKGAPGARETLEARDALERLAWQALPHP